MVHCMRVEAGPSTQNSLERTLQQKRHWMVLLHLVAVSKQCWMNYSWRRDKQKKKMKEEERYFEKNWKKIQVYLRIERER
ncbi:hypothetical protein GIB67_017680 [Kingdonia uniflora]|uniref:Uncharacterized protein n=1 Tax=Kingdonia uniflora TaxID=39325 RepID=A0A7J7NAB2_9MAGN|nr:hypothetical protein GIB67_017680 [Kingdonia uniflora]